MMTLYLYLKQFTVGELKAFEEKLKQILKMKQDIKIYKMKWKPV